MKKKERTPYYLLFLFFICNVPFSLLDLLNKKNKLTQKSSKNQLNSTNKVDRIIIRQFNIVDF